MKPLFNMDRQSELYGAIVGAYKALIKRMNTFRFRQRDLKVRTNGKGRQYVEIPAHLTVRVRVYAARDGKSTVMAVVDDLFARTAKEGQYDNPVLWGQIKEGGSGTNLFFFNDPKPQEVRDEVRKQLSEMGHAEIAKEV